MLVPLLQVCTDESLPNKQHEPLRLARPSVAALKYMHARRCSQCFTTQLYCFRIRCSGWAPELGAMKCRQHLDRFSRTALMWAAEMGHQECALTLIEFGADVSLAECNGR
eukprot:465874-Pelagomonas_calceolata.AAC.4